MTHQCQTLLRVIEIRHLGTPQEQTEHQRSVNLSGFKQRGSCSTHPLCRMPTYLRRLEKRESP